MAKKSKDKDALVDLLAGTILGYLADERGTDVSRGEAIELAERIYKKLGGCYIKKLKPDQYHAVSAANKYGGRVVAVLP